jgi:hypothetical protein
LVLQGILINKYVMKKYFLIIVLMISGLLSQAQLIINLQLPPSGAIQKNQLWNMLVTNTSQNNINASITMTIVENQTGEQILSATTGPVIIPPGNVMLNSTVLMPILYNVFSSSYNIDPSQNGFLPAGSFLVCYTYSDLVSKGAIAQECNTIDIEPLSPPQLVFPEDQTAIDSTSIPQFTWLPPAPLNLFTNLQYDLYLVQMDSGQVAADAIHSNIPILYQQDISGTSLMYPTAAPALQSGVQYAWEVVAKNNETPVSNSEAWIFTLKGFGVDSIEHGELPFTRLQKNGESGYSICDGKLKFAYINETADTAWNVILYDISSSNILPLSFGLDSVPMNKGLNLVQIDLSNNLSFIDQHIYLLELHNSRNEVWRMKFEYLKPGN